MSGAQSRSWPVLLRQLLAGGDLTFQDTAWAMDQIMSGTASDVQIAGFLVGLRAKGETAAEVGGLAAAMIEHAVPITVPGPTLDIVGTGGDQAHTVNISTMASIVAAAAGARVVKHGNRAASSRSGSADVLEALGVRLDLPAPTVQAVAEQAGITFCFAQTFHPAMRYAATTRGGLGVPTAFNVLGPLTNPARATHGAVGAAETRIAELIARVFADRGTQAAVFRGDDGLDEITVTGTSTLWWVRDGRVTQHQVDPRSLGMTLSPVEALRGGDGVQNAAVARAVFEGSRRDAVRDAVLLNAGVALAVIAADDGHGDFGRFASLDEALADGLARAGAAIDDGAAVATLDRWVSVSSQLAGSAHLEG